eukprot:Rmarinus@m.12070
MVEEGLTVHRCNFVDWVPSPITALSYSKDGSRLAVGHEDGNIDVWRTDYWILERTLIGTASTKSPSSIVWTSGTSLICSSLSGYLTTWNLADLRSGTSVESHGGAVWGLSMDESGSYVAAACDDGGIRVFDATVPNDVIFHRAFERQSNRMLSIACRGDWSKHGLSRSHVEDGIAYSGGADGTIRRWDSMGRCTLRITVEQLGRKQNTLVWALAVLPDRTLVSGDSLGNTQFWDGDHGTLISGFRSHDSAVMAVAASPDAQTVFSCGVDSKVVVFSHVPKTQDAQSPWVFSGRRRHHTHDVRALACSPTRLQLPRHSCVSRRKNPAGSSSENLFLLSSGGVDAKLCLYGALPSGDGGRDGQLAELLPYPSSQPYISYSPHTRLLASFGPTGLDSGSGAICVWRIPSVDSSAEAFGCPRHEKILHFIPSSRRNLRRVLLSPSAVPDPASRGRNSASPGPAKTCYLAVTDSAATRVFALMQERKAALRKISFEKPLPCCTAMAFVPARPHLLLAVAGSDRALVVADLSKRKISGRYPWPQSSVSRSRTPMAASAEQPDHDAIVTVCVSDDGKWVAAGDMQDNVHLYAVEHSGSELKLRHHHHLVRQAEGHRNLVFSPDASLLLVISAANEFTIFDVSSGEVTEWSRSIPDTLRSQLGTLTPFVSAAFVSGAPSANGSNAKPVKGRGSKKGKGGSKALPYVLLWSHDGICYVDLNKPPPAAVQFAEPSRKRLRAGADDDYPVSPHGKRRVGSAAVPVQGPAANAGGSGATPASSADAVVGTHRVEAGSFLLDKHFQSLLAVSSAGRELLVIQRPWQSVLECLPEPLARTRFGT